MKKERIVLSTKTHQMEAVLHLPEKACEQGVILAHGAGSNMDSPFMRFFHERIAEAGYSCMRFNFPYMQAGKKAPDPQPVLIAAYREAVKSMPAAKLVIGGKSMGGRIASYVAGEERVNGLMFIGYPLHPPGKPDQLRDEHLYSIRKPMIFLSGTRDPFARPDLFSNTLKRIGNFAVLHSVEGGGHSLEVPRKSGVSEPEVLEGALGAILRWLETLRS